MNKTEINRRIEKIDQIVKEVAGIDLSYVEAHRQVSFVWAEKFASVKTGMLDGKIYIQTERARLIH